MANTFTTNEQVMLDDIVEGFDKSLVLSNQASEYKPADTEIQRQGDNFWVPEPMISTTVSGMDISGQYGDVEDLAINASLANIQNVPWQLDAKELRDPRLLSRKKASASQALASKVETVLAAHVAETGIQVIKRGSHTGYDDVAAADTRLAEIGVGEGERSLFLSAKDNNALSSNLANRQNLQAGKTQTAFERNYLNMYAGFETFRTDVAPRLTAAAPTATVTVNGANQVLTPSATYTENGKQRNQDNRYYNLTVNSTAGVKAGDAFTIDGVESVHMISKEQTGELFTNRVVSVVDGTTLRVYRMVSAGAYQNVTAAPANGATLTFLNTVSTAANVFWRNDSVQLIKGNLGVSELEGEYITSTTENGIVIAMGKQSAIDDLTQKYRFTIFFDVENLNPQMNGVILFNQT